MASGSRLFHEPIGRMPAATTPVGRRQRQAGGIRPIAVLGVVADVTAMDKVVACETCGLVQQVDFVPEGSVVKCARCDFRIAYRRSHSRTRTLAFSIAAAILYFPSNFYPIVTAYYQGQHTQTTIFQGIKSLWQHQQYFISALVFCTSIFSPALKIIGLILIATTLDWPYWKKARTWTYRIICLIDPWNMLEVFLLAISVSMI